MQSVRQALVATVVVGLLATPVFAEDDTPDLLPGVDLVTEEVEPGVFRVLSDGVRELAAGHEQRLSYPAGSYSANNIAAGLDGSIWRFGLDGFFRLGDDTTHEWDTSLAVTEIAFDDFEVAADGTVWWKAGYNAGQLSSFAGETWTPRREIAVGVEVKEDGTVWAAWVDDDQIRVGHVAGDDWDVLPGELDAGYPNWPGSQPLAVSAGTDDGIWQVFDQSDGITVTGDYGGFAGVYEVAPDASLWFDPAWDGSEDYGYGCGGIARFDGESLTRYLGDRCVYAMDIAPDGHVWLLAGDWTELDRPGPVETYVITPEAVAE